MVQRLGQIRGMRPGSNGRHRRRHRRIILRKFPLLIVGRTNIRRRRLSTMATSHTATHWHHFDDLEHQQRTTLFGMWIFLATEILIFGAIFTAYTVYRLEYTAAFEAASHHLNLWIGGIN